MWAFWWIFPLIGIAVCLAFFVLAFRAASTGGGFMCMRHRADDEQTAALRREIERLREEIEQLRAARPATTA
jgi:hypothetical protein